MTEEEIKLLKDENAALRGGGTTKGRAGTYGES